MIKAIFQSKKLMEKKKNEKSFEHLPAVLSLHHVELSSSSYSLLSYRKKEKKKIKKKAHIDCKNSAELQ